MFFPIYPTLLRLKLEFLRLFSSLLSLHLAQAYLRGHQSCHG
jgi:hypothetical protein